MDRHGVVEALEELAALSDLLGENPFKAKAYANAARALLKTPVPETRWLETGVLESVPGVGKGTAERVRELLASGRMAELEAQRAKVPAGVREILSVPGLGPKKVAILWRDLGVASIGELEYACLENRLVALSGFGPKTQEKVLAGVRFRALHRGRVLLPAALAAQKTLEEHVRAAAGDAAFRWVGEAARRCNTAEELDLVVAGASAAAEVASRLGLHSTAPGLFSGKLTDGWRMTLRSVGRDSLGAASVWHASSGAFRDALQERLAAGGWAWDARGLLREGLPARAPSEEDFWALAGLRPIPPECRESPEALDADLSDLVREEDIRGSFHVHTDWSDGGATLEAMVSAAEALGWSYLGICDHSVTAAYAGGLSSARLGEQRLAIAEAQSRHPGILVLAGVESDVLGDGALDYPDEVLSALDLVVASVHSRFGLEEASQTERVVRAVKHTATTFLGHPTGRLLLSREAYALRWEAVAEAAAESGKAIELNANPHRLDVDWTRIPGLRASGVPIAINTDAHSLEGLHDVKYGVWAARKGLARRRDVLNTMTREEIGAYLASRKDARP